MFPSRVSCAPSPWLHSNTNVSESRRGGVDTRLESSCDGLLSELCMDRLAACLCHCSFGAADGLGWVQGLSTETRKGLPRGKRWSWSLACRVGGRVWDARWHSRGAHCRATEVPTKPGREYKSLRSYWTGDNADICPMVTLPLGERKHFLWFLRICWIWGS